MWGMLILPPPVLGSCCHFPTSVRNPQCWIQPLLFALKLSLGKIFNLNRRKFLSVKCGFLGGRASTASYLWADSLCRTNSVSSEWAPSFLGMDFWGVCGKRGCAKRKQKIPCSAETFSLFLVPDAGNSLLFCPAGGGAGGCCGLRAFTGC